MKKCPECGSECSGSYLLSCDECMYCSDDITKADLARAIAEDLLAGNLIFNSMSTYNAILARLEKGPDD